MGMKKRSLLFSLRYPLIALAVAILALIIGSFADLSLSSSLYIGSKTIITLISYVTPIAGLFVLSGSGVLLFLYYKNAREKSKKALSYVALLIAPLGGLIYGYAILTSLSTAMALIAGALLGCVAALLIYFLLRKEDPKNFFAIGYFFLFASILIIAFSLLLNKTIVRPTYSMLLLSDEAGTDYASFYRAWYLFSVDKTGYPSDLAASYYASFPSLSSAISSLGLLLPALCRLSKKGNNKELIVFIVASTLFVANAAILILGGSAFLSDIGFALLLGCFPLFLSVAISSLPKEVSQALLANQKKETEGIKAIRKKGFRYGVGARRSYDMQISPIDRKSIRNKNNRTKKKGSLEGPFFKLTQKR